MRILNLCIAAIFALILSYFLPIFANLFLPEYKIYDRVRYSPLVKDFLFSTLNKKENTQVYEVAGGERIDEDTFMRYQPFTYYSLLIPKGKFPSEFRKYEDNVTLIIKDSQSLNLRQGFNEARYIPLYPVLDVEPKFGKVIYSPFLIKLAAQRLEVVDARRNGEDVVVSSQLNEELKKAGFKHGAKAYFLNPSIMKGFDEGGFLIDSDDKIFHLKFKDGKFSAVDTKIKKPGIVNIVVIENERREFYAVLIAKDGLGLISYDNYAYVPLPSVGYDYAASDLYLKITPEYKMLAFSDEEAIYTYVTNLKYELEKQNFTRASKPISDRALKRYVFPFEAHIAQKEGAYRFEFKNFAPQSVFASLILAFAFFAYNLRFYKRRAILESAFVLIFGIYGFIAMIFYNTDKGKI